jgi:hypothetical protein
MGGAVGAAELGKKMTVFDLLMAAPTSAEPAVSAAYKAALNGNWKEASKQLGFAAEICDGQFSKDCGELSDQFYRKAT